MPVPTRCDEYDHAYSQAECYLGYPPGMPKCPTCREVWKRSHPGWSVYASELPECPGWVALALQGWEDVREELDRRAPYAELAMVIQRKTRHVEVYEHTKNGWHRLPSLAEKLASKVECPHNWERLYRAAGIWRRCTLCELEQEGHAVFE